MTGKRNMDVSSFFTIKLYKLYFKVYLNVLVLVVLHLLLTLVTWLYVSVIQICGD